MTMVIKEKIIESTKAASVEKRKPVIDAQGRSYATGKRKNSIARVWIKKGNGKITVNEREVKSYLGREILVRMVNAPFATTKNEGKFDVVATIVGGGLTGQAGALTHGISKALVEFDSENHKVLRVNGFLTRDSRVVERKKYGLKKARKGPTYRKR